MKCLSQSDVLAFLATAEGLNSSTAPVRIDTHDAVVFLAGDDVYKIKRAVSYPYMDFSTLAKRKAACKAEIEINKAYAPELYLGMMPVTWDGDRLQLGGQGPIVEWAVHMRRFNEDATLDKLADRNELTPELIDELARTVSESHKSSRISRNSDTVAAIRTIIAQTMGEVRSNSDTKQSKTVAKLDTVLQESFLKYRAFMTARTTDGYVRRCHGDLHLRNIVVIDEKPVLFDALEFDEAMATIDILYDLAFLIMDLLHRGRRTFACRLLNRYLWASEAERDDLAGLALLPMYMALRASIRAAVLEAQAKVTGCLTLQSEISAYLAEGLSYLENSSPGIIAIGGMSGSGKSTISDILAPLVGSAPGAIHLRSDIERKKRFGVAPTDRLEYDAYNDKVSEEIYSSLLGLATLAIKAGRTAIVDATFIQERWRRKMAALASDLDVSFHGVWLNAPALVLENRLKSRGKDASDATVSILQLQLQTDRGMLDWHNVDASRQPEEIVRDILNAIDLAPTA